MASKKKAKAKAAEAPRKGKGQKAKGPSEVSRRPEPKASPKGQGQKAKTPPAPPEPIAKLSMLSAAAKLLAETRKPMKCREMIEVMKAKGLWTSPAGKTPDATLQAAIIREIARKKEASRFKKTAPGTFVSARGL